MLKRRSLFPINGNQVFRWWDALDNQGKSRSPILQPWSFHLKLERAKKKEPRKGEEEKKMKRRKKKKGRRYIWIPCGIHDPNSHQTQQGVAIFFFLDGARRRRRKNYNKFSVCCVILHSTQSSRTTDLPSIGHRSIPYIPTEGGSDVK